MSEAPSSAGALSILFLVEVRRFVRESHARMMVVFFALLYGLGSMVLGGMLIITRVPGGYTSEVLWGNALGTGAWNYPGFLFVAPWGIISLPFLAFWSMVYVALGVGLGTTVAILISVRLVRDLRRSSASAGTVGTVAGLTPAMIALVTLGACCSTTAAATAGVGLVAQASGSTVSTLLVNNWYLDVFQVVVLSVALVAQEMLLQAYGGLFGLNSTVPGDPTSAASVPPSGLGSWAAGAFRTLLLVAGVTWSLAMFAEWTTVAPATAGAVLWFQWIVQHQLLAGLAIAVALSPSAVGRALTRRAAHPVGWALRAVVLVGGLSLAVGVPAFLAAGAPGLLNEVVWVIGGPGAWGSSAPVFAPGLTLYLRWTFQYVLLGGFAFAVAVFPTRVLRWLGARADSWASDSADLAAPEGRDRDAPALTMAGVALAGPEPRAEAIAGQPR